MLVQALTHGGVDARASQQGPKFLQSERLERKWEIIVNLIRVIFCRVIGRAERRPGK